MNYCSVSEFKPCFFVTGGVPSLGQAMQLESVK